MPKKPKKWRMKLWVLIDFISKYVYTFDVYCGKNLEVQGNELQTKDEANVAYEVVMELLEELEDRGHYLVMNNLFCSIHLFKYLVLWSIYAIEIDFKTYLTTFRLFKSPKIRVLNLHMS